MHWRRLSLVAACGLASGCLVSFEGYQLGADGGSGGASATAGDASGGKVSGGGKASGGKASAGSDVGGDAGEAGGGESGTAAGSGGSAGSPPGGSDSGGSSGAGGSGGSGGSGGTPPESCPINLEGPPMTEVPKTGGGFFCMDRTEVPNEDYAVFLATDPSTGNQGATCAWNDSFQPDTVDCPTSTLGQYDPAVRPRVPVSCVDWCDAKRYCEWTGKRLCGAIAGGANLPGSHADANASQWFRACSKAGSQRFPYGNTYQGSYCVGLDNSGVHPSPVTSLTTCQGGYDGIYDMSGNVAEWEDSCSASAGEDDPCLVRGGDIQSVENTAPSLLCNDSAIDDATPQPVTANRSWASELIGFRCCLDP